MRTTLEIACACNVLVKFIAEQELSFKDDENVRSPRNFFQNNFQNFFKQA